MDGSSRGAGANAVAPGRRGSVVVAQLVLAPVLGLVAFGFAFVGYGLSPDGGDAVGLQDAVVLGLYVVVLATVIALPAGAVVGVIASRSGRPAVARRAAVVPLAMAAVSGVILLGLLIAATAFGQVPAP